MKHFLTLTCLYSGCLGLFSAVFFMLDAVRASRPESGEIGCMYGLMTALLLFLWRKFHTPKGKLKVRVDRTDPTARLLMKCLLCGFAIVIFVNMAASLAVIYFVSIAEATLVDRAFGSLAGNGVSLLLWPMVYVAFGTFPRSLHEFYGSEFTVEPAAPKAGNDPSSPKESN